MKRLKTASLTQFFGAVALSLFLSPALFVFPGNAGAIVPGAKLSTLDVKDSEGKPVTLESIKDKTVVFEWVNIECPFSQELYTSGNLATLQKTAKEKGAIWITVDSTNSSHRNYHNAAGVQDYLAKYNAQPDHLVKDEDGSLGQFFGAKTTPHVFVVNPKGVVAYEGAIDDQPKLATNRTSAKSYVIPTIDAIHDSKEVSPSRVNPYGCSVKY